MAAAAAADMAAEMGAGRDMDDEEDEEEDLSKFSRRKCQRCGKMEYLRKGGCANPACAAWMCFFWFPLRRKKPSNK